MNASVVKPMLATLAIYPPVPIRVSLTWHADDPHRVQMDIHLEDGRTFPWWFAWELLAEGAKQPAGIGDVRIGPGDPDCTEILLDPGSDKQCRLIFDTHDLNVFLGETWEMPHRMHIPTYLEDIFADLADEEAS